MWAVASVLSCNTLPGPPSFWAVASQSLRLVLQHFLPFFPILVCSVSYHNSISFDRFFLFSQALASQFPVLQHVNDVMPFQFRQFRVATHSFLSQFPVLQHVMSCFSNLVHHETRHSCISLELCSTRHVICSSGYIVSFLLLIPTSF